MSEGVDPGEFIQEFIINTRVQIIGLTSRTELNGQTGTVVARDSKYADRWHVKLDETGNIKAFKYENLWEVQADLQDADEMQIQEAVVNLGNRVQDTVQELSHLRQEVFAQRTSSEDFKKLMSESEAVLNRLQGAEKQDHSPMDISETMRLINEAVEREVDRRMSDVGEKAADSNVTALEEQVKKLDLDLKVMRAEALRGQKRLVELERISMKRPGQDKDNGNSGITHDSLILQRVEQSEKLCEVKIELLKAQIDEMSEDISSVRSQLSEAGPRHGSDDKVSEEVNRLTEEMQTKIQVILEKVQLDIHKDNREDATDDRIRRIVVEQMKNAKDEDDSIDGEGSQKADRIRKEILEQVRADKSRTDKEEASQMVDRIRKEVLEQVRVDRSRFDSQDKGSSAFGPSAILKLVHEEVEHEMETCMKDVNEKVNVLTASLANAVSKIEQNKSAKASKAFTDNEQTMDALAEMREQMSEYRADIVEVQGAISVIREQLKDQEENVMRTTILKCLKRVEHLEKVTAEFGKLSELEARIRKLFESRCVLVDKPSAGPEKVEIAESHAEMHSTGNGKHSTQPDKQDGTLEKTIVLQMMKRIEKLESNEKHYDRLGQAFTSVTKQLETVVPSTKKIEKLEVTSKLLEARVDGLESGHVSLTSGKPHNGEGSSSFTLQEVKILYQRLADMLEDISELQSEVRNFGQRLDVTESQGTGSGDPATTIQVQALFEYLSESGVITGEARYAAVLHRCKYQREIKAARARGWTPDASAAQIAQEEGVLQTLSSFVTPQELVDFRMALASTAPEHLAKRVLLLAGRGRAETRLACASEAAQSQPSIRSMLELQEARAAAESVGVNARQLEEAKMIIRKGIATAASNGYHAEKASGNGHPSESDLASALELARDIGGDSFVMEEIKEAMRLNRHESEKVEKVLRKLKVAACWATSKDHDRLREVIMEAEQTKLADSHELRKAKSLLYSLQFPRNDVVEFPTFLKAARPKWTDQDVANARAKLEKVGVVSAEGLLEVLRKDGEQGLQTMLREAGLKVFSEDTLKAFQLYI